MNFNEKYEALMKELEKNMESKKDLEYIKTTFYQNMAELLKNSNMEKNTNGKEYDKKQTELEHKITELEEAVKRIEKDIYVNDNYDFEIVCPYCNTEFETDFDESKTEIRCPECNNLIELDWNEDNCHNDCSCCHGVCDEEEEEEGNNTKKENNEEDM